MKFFLQLSNSLMFVTFAWLVKTSVLLALFFCNRAKMNLYDGTVCTQQVRIQIASRFIFETFDVYIHSRIPKIISLSLDIKFNIHWIDFCSFFFASFYYFFIFLFFYTLKIYAEPNTNIEMPCSSFVVWISSFWSFLLNECS